MFSTDFICAGTAYSTYTEHIPAPYLRKSFSLKQLPSQATIHICGLGFYRLFINGTEVTKGLLAPYMSNPDHILYYDTYDLLPHLTTGENVLGILLGNGILNCPGGRIWDFDKAAYRSAPKVALSLHLINNDETQQCITADETFRVHPSAILFDDLRCGEFYDARLEADGWNRPGFDDSNWAFAQKAQTPKGNPTLCSAEPIKKVKTLKPVSIQANASCLLPDDKSSISYNRADFQGYLYDFGENLAGLLRLQIKGKAGQRISIQTGELLSADGQLDLRPMQFQPLAMNHKIVYTLKGGQEEEYLPSFTYFGMRYCLVSGITSEQATEHLLSFEVMSSALEKNGDFSCSDPVINQLQKATYNADISNFYYFPTDCPHREKNGWTGDIALSAQQLLFNLKCENSLCVWLNNLRAAQTETGSIPCIVPTAGWGYRPAVNGPAWDAALFQVPYYIWLYRGDDRAIRENADAMARYLPYLASMRNQQGVLDYGLWDYVPILYKLPRTPQITSSTLYAMDICQKAALMFREIGRHADAAFAENLYKEIRLSARKVLLETDGITVLGCNQGAQAMGIYYGLFTPGEKDAALRKLLHYIQLSDGKMDVGVLSGRVIFHVLAQNGYAELAYKMIVGPDYPSYGHWVLQENCTALFESFKTADDPNQGSKNHHFWGDISAWFIQYLAGIRINPFARNINELNISPCFIAQLDQAEGFINIPAGTVAVKWQRTQSGIHLTTQIPEGCNGYLRLPDGYYVMDKKFPTAAVALAAGKNKYTILQY